MGFFPEFILQWVDSATGVCTPRVVREWVEGRRHRIDHCARWNVQLHAHEVLLSTLHSCKVVHRVTASIVYLALALQMLESDLDLDWELEDLGRGFGLIS